MTSSIATRSGGLSPPWAKDFIAYLFLVAAICAAYANVYHYVFLYDDDILIVHNRFLRDWHYLSTLFITNINAGGNTATLYYRPLQILLYMLVFQAAGSSTVAFHILNVALHAANACLVYWLGRRLNFKPAAAFFASMLWALHPLNVEAVTYMSATADVLFAFFCLAGVIVLLPDFTPRRVLVAALLMVLGLLSKESAVIFPLLAMGTLYFISDKRFAVRTYLRLWPLFLVAVIYVVARGSVMNANPQIIHDVTLAPPASVTNYASFAALAIYARLIFWPSGLHMEHDLPIYSYVLDGTVLVGIGLILLAAVQIVRRQTERSRPLSWGLCWFAMAMLPVFDVNEVLYEHWLYLPLAGFFLGAMQSIYLYLEKLSLLATASIKFSSTAFVSIVVLGLGFLTYRHNEAWRDPVSFYQNMLSQDEPSPKAHIDLGIVYSNNGDYKKALEQFQLGLANASNRLSTFDIATAHYDWGTILLRMSEGEASGSEALAHFQIALQNKPDFYLALQALADFYAKHGDAVQAANYQSRADSAQKKYVMLPDETVPGH